MRLDTYLSEKKYTKSRERAKELIKAGKIIIDGKTVTKPSFEINENSQIDIIGEQLKYVGRGGLKLEKAIEEFHINLNGKVCIDIGASTGGFTDCMLQNGAEYVYAIDVGHDQLDDSLINDIRVCNMEKTNVKNLTCEAFTKKPEFISVDVSFISLKQILPKVKEFLTYQGEAVVLIKPQFEAGKSYIGKNGIIKDPKVHITVLENITLYCLSEGLQILNIINSPITGGDGNIEYLAHIKNGVQSLGLNYSNIVSTAFNKLK